MNIFRRNKESLFQTNKSFAEINTIMYNYTNHSEKIQKWRFNNGKYELSSKERTFLLFPFLPIFMITIEVFERESKRHITGKVRGNSIIDSAVYMLGFLVIVASIYLIFEREFYSSITNIACLFILIIFFYQVNLSYRKKGKEEYRKIKNLLLAGPPPAGSPPAED
jgi:hypothetical protein